MSTDNRPLSPHIQVYRWQFTMVLSILHRATGAGLAFGALLMGWWLMAAVKGPEAFAQFHDFTHSIPGQLMLAGWVWAFVFHFLNGIRHLVWDTGRGFTIKGARHSGQVVFLLSLVGAALVWVAA
jgi:succinate dehydrogenase / fumarate reductase cytochrome b subunit